MENFERGQKANGSAVNGNDRDTLLLLGGVALVVFGAGLILTNPTARKLMSQAGLPDLSQLALPDLERYMKLRSM